MNVTMLLADSAQVADDKLYVLGGGWTVTGPGPAPMAVAAIIEVSWEETNLRQAFQLSLLDEDGMQVLLPSPNGGNEAVSIDGQFEVGRPVGTPPGAELNFPVAINLAPMPLAPGKRYVWALRVGEAVWQKSFSTRPAVQAQ